MPFQGLFSVPLLRRCLYRLGTWRVKEKLIELEPYFNTRENILDIGSGNCLLCHELTIRNYSVTALDVDNFSFVDDINPVIYDGFNIPFADERFSLALLVTVLHHTRNPERVLSEAMRVAKRIIVIEEIYSNIGDKWLTYFIDSVFNLEFVNHPHSNKTDTAWQDAFKQLGLKLLHVKYSRSIWVLKRVTYVLEKESKEPLSN
jgi:SAM-dependent methyltransferase